MQDEHQADGLGARVGAALAEVRQDPDPGFERRMAEGARERALGRRARLTTAMALVSAMAAAVMIWILEHPAARVGSNAERPAPGAVLPTCCTTSAAEAAADELSLGELRELMDTEGALSISADWDRATRPLSPYTRLLGGER